MADRVETVSGVEVGEADLQVAAALAEVLREAAADLAFGAEPLDLVVALERLAAEEEQ